MQISKAKELKDKIGYNNILRATKGILRGTLFQTVCVKTQCS